MVLVKRESLPEPARRVLEDVEALKAELGAEAVDGLYSIVEGSEDITCLSVKKLKGRRDKLYGKGNLFRR